LIEKFYELMRERAVFRWLFGAISVLNMRDG